MASKLVAKNPKSTKPSKPKILIYGKSGVGKTWGTIEFPNVYYIDSEGGADLTHYTDKLSKSGGVYMGQNEGANDFAVIIDQIKALATEKHPYRTVVIDSISKVFNTAISLEAERLGSANAYGADKKPAVNSIRQLVNWIDRIDMNVILVAHEKTEWGMVTNSQGKQERSEVGATFDCFEKLEYELHLALRIVKQGKSRKAFIRKTRLLGFPEGESFDWSYSEFAERYGRDVMEGEVTQVVLASASQVGEVKKLLETVKLEPDFAEKCLAKATANSWEELESGQIEKTIEFLRKKLQL